MRSSRRCRKVERSLALKVGPATHLAHGPQVGHQLAARQGIADGFR